MGVKELVTVSVVFLSLNLKQQVNVISSQLLSTPSSFPLPTSMPLVNASPGVRVHYMVPSCLDRSDTIDPTKPTVILLHPPFFDSHFFARQYGDGRLARGYNLVTLDHHYHGRTEAELDDKAYDFQLVRDSLHGTVTFNVQRHSR